MFYLVRKTVLGSNDEFQDLDYEVDELIIGSDESCVAFLDELNEGNITIRTTKDNQAKFSCSGDLQLGTDKGDKKSGVISAGKIYKLGVYDIEIIKPPSGFDFALNVVRSKRKGRSKNNKFKIENKKSKFSIRSLSYLLFLFIILWFLVIPFMGSKDAKINQKLKSLPIATDKSWLSGPMAMAHRIPEIGDNCQVCHVKPFEKVHDKQCLDCHRNLSDHVAQNHPAVEALDEFICENCHKEHNEPAQITREDDALCINCHQDMKKYQGKAIENDVAVKDVKGFNSNNHPPFRLSLLQAVEKQGFYEWKISRPLFDVNNPPTENSNLKFSHTVHLDEEKVQDDATGEALICNNCHQLKGDGEHFEPITMDKDCRSCHHLTFDVFNPDLELPHGNLRAATVMLEAHYIREFTDPKLREKRSRKKVRRIPGKHTNQATCEGTGLNCGRAEAMKEAEFQFNKSGCITCHEVTTTGDQNLLTKWFVKPIKLNDDWYSKAQFDHTSHLSVKGQDTEEICLSCHDVKNSEVSSDIAMPQRNKCLECHRQDDDHSVELSCTSCHAFHLTDTESKEIQRK
jgi:predicted CXXCH cytochrome family protein